MSLLLALVFLTGVLSLGAMASEGEASGELPVVTETPMPLSEVETSGEADGNAAPKSDEEPTSLLSLNGAASDPNDLVIAPTNAGDSIAEGTDYTYENGELVINTTTPVTISMADGVTSTGDTIKIWTNVGGAVDVTLAGVNISVSQKWYAIQLNGTVNGQAVTNDYPCTIHLVGENTLSNTASYGPAMRYYGAGTALTITSSSQGVLNLSNNGQYGTLYSEKSADLTINGSAVVNVSSASHTGLNNCGTTTISGSAKVTISAVTKAIISGNESGNCVKISGNAELEIKKAETGIYVNGSGGSLLVSDNAKVKIDTVSGDGVYAYYGGVSVSDSSTLEITKAARGVYARKEPVAVTGNAEIKIVEATGTNGIYAAKGVTASDSASITIEKAAQVGINGATELSGSAQLSISSAGSNGIKGALSLSGNASATICASGSDAVLSKNFSASPAEGKAYMVKTGASEAEASCAYYPAQSNVTKDSGWRYFHAETVSEIPVTITGTNGQTTFDSSQTKPSEYDISQLFSIDANAGTVVYSVESGSGTLSGSILTITQPGEVTVKVTAAKNGLYAAGEATAVLTVLPVTQPVEPVAAAYKIEYYRADGTGGYALVEEDTQFPLYAQIGQSVLAQEKQYDGYIYNAAISTAGGTVAAITSADDMLVLRLYYEKEFTVRFDPCGGSLETDTAVTGVDGTLVSDLPVPEQNGYRFNGWFTAKNGGEQVTTETVYTADTVLYAQWTKLTTDSTQTAPATGDRARPLLLSAVLTASLLLLGGVLYSRRKVKN